MALTDKNIVITPNTGQAADPKIVFSGADASTAAQNITLQVYPTNSGTLSWEGSAGQLFSITNSMSGTIYSVNDVSGIPSIEVLDTGLVKLAQYSGNVLLGTGTDNGTDKLQVNGSITGTVLKSSVATGTAPLTVTSTTAVANLNADMLDGNHASAFYLATNPSGYTTNTGTVTSVGGTGSVSGLTLSGTVTTTGNLTLGGTLAVTPSNFASQTANTFLAAPNGTAGTPTFRALVVADIPTLNQNTTGSAATLTTARTLTIGSTGKTFNGSADVTWSLAEIGAFPVNNNAATDLNAVGQGLWRINTGHTNQPTGTDYGTLLSFDNNSDTGFQLASDYSSNNFYWRSGNATIYGGTGSFGAWRKLLHDGNYNSYSPTLTGTGASGTWGISVSGNATTATSIADGSAGTIPYQTANSTTAMLAAGTSGYFLKANGAAAPSWAELSLTDLPDAWAKKSVKAATTAAITLSGTQTIDGIAVVAGDRVLVKDQTISSENGIYVVAAGAWTRATDANTASKLAGAVVNVDRGTSNGGVHYDTDFKLTDTLDTTSIIFSRVLDSAYLFSQTGPIATLGTLVPGTGGYKNGTHTSVLLSGGTGNNVKATVVVSAGAVTSITLTHPGWGYTTGDVLSLSSILLGGLAVTATSGTGTTATLTFAAQATAPFQVGSKLYITGLAPAGYNVSGAVVTACTTTTVSYANTTTGAMTTAGTVYSYVTSGEATIPVTAISQAALTLDKYVSDSIGSRLRLQCDDTGILSNQELGAIVFNSKSSSYSGDLALFRAQAASVAGGSYFTWHTSAVGTVTPTLAMTLAANNTLSVAGTIESTTGGFKFPDGTIQTTSNKPRVVTIASTATPSINADTTDIYGITTLATNITSVTVTGTPTNGQKLWIYIVGTATRTITWGTSFESSTTILPTTTVTTNRLDVGFVWNAGSSKWRCVAAV